MGGRRRAQRLPGSKSRVAGEGRRIGAGRGPGSVVVHVAAHLLTCKPVDSEHTRASTGHSFVMLKILAQIQSRELHDKYRVRHWKLCDFCGSRRVQDTT